MTAPPVLVTAQELHALALSGERPVILDVRWALGTTDGYERYLEAHIPGAVYADLESELAAPADPVRGRHPLPELEVLQEAARRWGLDDDSPVVVYDAVANLSAARAWWVLRWAGVRDVRLLDGGLDAWRAAAYELEAGPATDRHGTVTLRPGALEALDAGGA